MRLKAIDRQYQAVCFHTCIVCVLDILTSVLFTYCVVCLCFASTLSMTRVSVCIDWQEFIELACQSPAVVCCRCSPTHKAQVVRLLQQHTKRPVCAVGECEGTGWNRMWRYIRYKFCKNWCKFELNDAIKFPFSVTTFLVSLYVYCHIPYILFAPTTGSQS